MLPDELYKKNQKKQKTMKNALLLTGAAARISQEVAILDKLIEYRGLELNPESTLLAGFSSGALNIAAINACFRTNVPLNWDDYYKEEVLFKVKNKDVFQKIKFVPLDTKPLRKTVDRFLSDAQQHLLGDLTFPSYILAFSYRRLRTLWAGSHKPGHQDILLSDLLMATTAIPIIFPDQTIGSDEGSLHKFTQGSFADGGTGGSFKQFEKHLRNYRKQNQILDQLFIISPMREVTHEDYQDLYNMMPSFEMLKLNIKDIKLLRVFLGMISQNGFDTFIKRFYKWNLKKPVAKKIWVCIPDLEKNYPIMNFDLQKEQYQAVCQWIDQNKESFAVPIETYMKKFA